MKKSKQFAVIGLGRFGSSVARTLYRSGYDVLVIDADAERVQKFSSEVTHVVQADSTDEDALKAIGIRNFDVAVVAIGADMEANMLTVSLLREQGVPFIVAKARNELHGKLLEKIGADRIVYPERDMGIRVARNLVSTNVLDYIELSSELSLVEVTVPRRLVGRSLAEANLRNKYGVNVVAIKRGDALILPPLPSEKIIEKDILILVGKNTGVHKLEEME